MSIKYIGALAKYTYRLTATPNLITKLRVAKKNKSAAVWILTDTVLTFSSIPIIALSYQTRPGLNVIGFHTHGSDTLWALDVAESQSLTERINLIFGFRKELALMVAQQKNIVTDDFLQLKARQKNKDNKNSLFAFDSQIERLEFIRKLEKSRRTFAERHQPITAEQLENLLAHYNLWSQVQPRVKHFIRTYLTGIYPDGRHNHHHPVGLTQTRRIELEKMAMVVAETGKSGLLFNE